MKVQKLTGQFESLIQQFVRDSLAVLAAKKQDIPVSPDEIQKRADQFRRVRGLHRAADMNSYLDALGVSLDEFEAFITYGLYQEKMMERVWSDRAVEEYFKLNSPKFDCIEVSHIVLDGEGAAKDMLSVFADKPDNFAATAREHSRGDTRQQGGHIGKLWSGNTRSRSTDRRGMLRMNRLIAVAPLSAKVPSTKTSGATWVSVQYRGTFSSWLEDQQPIGGAGHPGFGAPGGQLRRVQLRNPGQGEFTSKLQAQAHGLDASATLQQFAQHIDA